MSNLTASVEEEERRRELTEFLRENRIEVRDRHDDIDEEPDEEELEELVE